jgi:hypothetical protein
MRARLTKVVELAPNHESAKYLLLLAAGKQPTKLTRSASLVAAVSAIAPVQACLWQRKSPGRADFPKSTANALDQQLRKVLRISHSDILPVVTKLVDFIDELDACASMRRLDRERIEKLDAAREAVHESLRKVSADRSVMELLTREGG